MSEMILRKPLLRKQMIELNDEEQAQVNTIIDLLIPSDENFPPPSSLHLIDDFLGSLIPSSVNKATLLLNEKRLRSLLRELNDSANGNFCSASPDKQQRLLQHFERREPALFQDLWTSVTHTY